MKFIVPFAIGILVSASIISIVMFLPIFQSNMPIYFGFSNLNGSYDNSNMLPTEITISNQGGQGEGLTLAKNSFQYCFGTSIYGYNGNIEITITEGNNPSQTPQTLSLLVPSVSIFDMVNHNIWTVVFEWNNATQQWQQQSPVTFAS
jgi:hypothetical protein